MPAPLLYMSTSAAVSPTQQIPLDLSQAPVPRLSNFLVGQHQELLSALHAWPETLKNGNAAPAQRLIYLWGENGSGRSHLLHATAHAASTAGLSIQILDAASPIADFAHRSSCAVYGVDDVETLSPEQQIALFNLYNAVRAAPQHGLLVTGIQPPLGLTVREDLRTRLGWGLVYQLHALADADKIAALQAAAKERGLVLSSEVPTWLLNHFYRDMPSLMALLDALDTYSLEQKRAVTLPLVRQMLGKL